MMDHRSSEHIEMQLHMERQLHIKTEMKEAVPSTAYIDSEIDVKHLKQEPGLVQHVKSGPVWSMEEAILEDNKLDEQHVVPVTSAIAVVSSKSVSAETVERGQLIHIKEQLEDTDLDHNHIVLQHTDSPYRIDQKENNTVLNLDTEETLSKIDYGQVALNEMSDETIESIRNDNAALVQSKTYICDMCKKTFKTRVAIRSHIRCVHGTSQFICPKCNKNFRCQQYLTQHIVFVHSPQHNCAICKKVFKCSKLLGDHVKFVHRNKSTDSSADLNTCDYCSEKFCSKRKLMSHLKNMHGSESCRCRAGKKSLRRQRFREKQSDKVDSDETNKHHSKRAHGTGSHKCTQCGKEFKRNSYLVRHVRYTHSEEQYECKICKKMYKSKVALRRHVSSFHRRKLADSQHHVPKARVYVQGTFRRNAVATSAAVGTSAQQHGAIYVKSEPVNTDLELGPVVFQHMDFNYRPYNEEPQHD